MQGLVEINGCTATEENKSVFLSRFYVTLQKRAWHIDFPPTNPDIQQDIRRRL